MTVLCSIRSQPVNSFEWGKDTVISLRFNPGEPNILATSGRYCHLFETSWELIFYHMLYELSLVNSSFSSVIAVTGALQYMIYDCHLLQERL